MKLILPVKNYSTKQDANGVTSYSTVYRTDTSMMRFVFSNLIDKFKNISDNSNAVKIYVMNNMTFNTRFNFKSKEEVIGFQEMTDEYLQTLTCNVKMLSIPDSIKKTPLTELMKEDETTGDTSIEALRFYKFVSSGSEDCRDVLDLYQVTNSNPDYFELTFNIDRIKRTDLDSQDETTERIPLYKMDEYRPKVLQALKGLGINLDFNEDGVAMIEPDAIYFCPESFSVNFIPPILGKYARSDENSLEYFTNDTCKETMMNYLHHITSAYRELLLASPVKNESPIYTLMLQTARVRFRELYFGGQEEEVQEASKNVTELNSVFNELYDHHTIYSYMSGFLPLFITTDKVQVVRKLYSDVLTPLKEYYLKVVDSLYQDYRITTGEDILIEPTAYLKTIRYFISDSKNPNTKFMTKYINYLVVKALLGSTNKNIDMESFHKKVFDTILANITKYKNS